MVRTLISLSNTDKAWLEQYSRRHRLPAAAVVREALRAYRNLEPRKSLQAVLKETHGAWQSVQTDSVQYVRELRASRPVRW